jgi:hypothetical protein
METSTQAAPAVEMGVGARLVGVFFSPARTFESIARKPGWDWLVPIALLLASILVSSAVVNPKLDVEGYVERFMSKMEARGNIPEGQLADIEKSVRQQFTFSTSVVGRAVGCAVFLLIVLVVPLIYHGIAAAMGAKTRYVMVLAGYAYVQMVQVVYWLLQAVVALPKERIDVVDAQLFRLVKSNPGAFMDPETTNRALLILVSSIDIFNIAALVIGSIALSKTTRLGPRGAAITVGGLWLLWVLLSAVLGMIQAAFGG